MVLKGKVCTHLYIINLVIFWVVVRSTK